MSFDSGRLSHAYIADAAQTAEAAAAVVCSADPPAARPCRSCKHCDKAKRGIHPDIINITRPQDKKDIIVDQIRALKKDAFILPNEANRKIYVIIEADLMNINAQNAFLQILEEPPPHTVFILQTVNPAALLPTIRSRCIELRAAPLYTGVSSDGTHAEELASEFVGILLNPVNTTSFNRLLTELMFKLEKPDKQVFSDFLTVAKTLIVTQLKAPAGQDSTLQSREPRENDRRLKLTAADRILSKAEEMLELNVGTGHLAGMICAQLLETKE